MNVDKAVLRENRQENAILIAGAILYLAILALFVVYVAKPACLALSPP